MLDLRPLSLCNALYKIVSKVLANTLNLLLSKCISQEQTPLIEKRSNLDNVLITMEIVHHMKCKTQGRFRELAMKINISKAFD